MRKTRMQKGITLIALIITIIILLILAIVTIGSIKNSNIIGYAQNAATDYNGKQDEEEGIIAGYESLIESRLPGENSSGDAVMPVATVGTIVEKNSTINGKMYSYENPVIPVGFKAINIETEEQESKWDTKDKQQIKNGLVIEDEVGNQFVWIPVPNISEFARIYDDVNYQGILYNFSGTSATEMSEGYFGIGTTKYREPDILTQKVDSVTNSFVDGADKEEGNLRSAGLTTDLTGDNKVNEEDFKQQLQNEFNSMVASVAKYGGFYVGRYETSFDGEKVQSKPGVSPMNNLTWYNMYKTSKTYTKNGVVSEMIWGCQYDAMMKFILTGKDAQHVTATGKVSHNGEDFNGEPYKTGGEKYPVGVGEYLDIASNIYDLEGNVEEWTQEGNFTAGRVCRGGYFASSSSPSNRNTGSVPDFSSNVRGSRLTIYIK